MNIIEIDNLSYYFADGTAALKNINLTVEAGSFVVIAGRNGSGKTTLFRHLNGLLMPDKGAVRVDGVSVKADLRRARQIVGMVFQDPDNQIVGETVKEDVAFGPENLCLARDKIEERVADALATVGLTALSERRPYLLSGGEKRRVAIAGILAMASTVLVFDEPFSNLDYPGIKQVLAQINTLHQAGHTVLIATHELEKVIALADRLVILQDGRIVRDGPPVEVVSGIEKFGVREPRVIDNGSEMASWLN